MISTYKKSEELFNKAKTLIPGGVNSPVRAFKSVGGTPVFIESAKGSRMYDSDGNEYIDYVSSWGAHLFGHNPQFLTKAIYAALRKGTSFGAATEMEIRFAELVCDILPYIERVRAVSSGTEATMSAIRLARGFTGRNKIIKFEGCYHGHGDSFLIKAGSGALTFGSPTSPGVTAGCAADTLVAQFNNIKSVEKLIEANKSEIAAIIIEPVAGNMGVVAAKKHFLQELREICDNEKIVLIFDEVMTGFRIAMGGAFEVYGIKPDLACFGKIIGGGLPVGAFGGKAEIMEMISPSGPVYQAGTLSGNPLAMAAGIANLTHIKENPYIYTELEAKASYLEAGFENNLIKLGKELAVNRAGSMLCLFMTNGKVRNYKEAIKSDTALYGRYFHEMLKRGIYLAPAQFEAMFVTTAHTWADLDKTIEANFESLEFLLR